MPSPIAMLKDARAKGLLRCSSGPPIQAVCNGPMMQRSKSLSFAETEIEEVHRGSRGSPRDGASQDEVNHKLQARHSEKL